MKGFQALSLIIWKKISLKEFPLYLNWLFGFLKALIAGNKCFPYSISSSDALSPNFKDQTEKNSFLQPCKFMELPLKRRVKNSISINVWNITKKTVSFGTLTVWFKAFFVPSNVVAIIGRVGAQYHFSEMC